MDAYYYCSYTGSPVGFILGKLSDIRETEEALELSKDGIEPFIRRCFESGMVRKACGLLPHEPKLYFLLLKKLAVKGSHDEPEYYLNIAFATEDRTRYSQWLDEDGAAAGDAIAQAVRETISLNRESDFGYEVKSKALEMLTKMKFGSLLEGCSTKVLEDGLYLELASHEANPDDVMQALGISGVEETLELIAEDSNWVCLVKKKRI